MQEIKIDKNKCKKDGLCRTVCSVGIFSQENKSEFPIISGEDKCINCGHCTAICPAGAINHSSFPESRIRLINKNKIPAYENLMELIRSRRSVRSFKNTEIHKETIDKIIDAARFAPSAENNESTKFIVVRQKKILGDIVRITIDFLQRIHNLLSNPIVRNIFRLFEKGAVDNAFHGLADIRFVIDKYREGRDVILNNADTIIVFYAKKNKTFALENANLSLQNATLAAHSLGVGNFYAGYVLTCCQRERKIHKILNIPIDHQIFGILALGIPNIKFNNWIEKKKPDMNFIE